MKSGIDNMREDDFLHLWDPGEAYNGFFAYLEKSVEMNTFPNIYVTPFCSPIFIVIMEIISIR